MGWIMELHPRLKADTIFLQDLELCQLLLLNDSNYPWLVLVPKRDVREFHDLIPEEQVLLMLEITQTSRRLEAAFKPFKINVASLGNVVPQMHIHVIGRYENDPAWPKPVWGVVPLKPYSEEELAKVKGLLQC